MRVVGEKGYLWIPLACGCVAALGGHKHPLTKVKDGGVEAGQLQEHLSFHNGAGHLLHRQPELGGGGRNMLCEGFFFCLGQVPMGLLQMQMWLGMSSIRGHRGG